ncbi:MAG: hypothetical protein QME46_03185 [Thermoanaerobacteraceae bacterium]|nr:hypothetical protein [Thermoanaerobacteraceae bacterium]
MSTPWKTDKWFVSPWNYEKETTEGLNFAPKIKIHDVTLRDGEQQAGVVFNKDQKVAIAEKLAEVGVHRIEAGMPAVSAQDEAAIKEIVKRNLGPQIFAFARCMKDDVKRSVDCGVDGVVIEIPSSTHLIQNGYKWSLEKAIDLSIEATRFAHDNGLYTVFFPIDGTRAELDWFLTLIEKVATEGHMDALGLVDTFGVLSPYAAAYMVKKVKERIKDKPIEVHFHDDFGMGAANTLMALSAGADVAHTTISALGERAGNAPYEELVLSLLTMYNIDLGLNYSKLYETSKLVRDIAHIPMRLNRPIVGDMLFNIESGIVAGWYQNCGRETPTEVAPFTPDLVGQLPTQVVLGKNSGMPSIEIWLDKVGVTATDEQKTEILSKVKERAFIKGWLLNENEFKEIVAKVVK